MGYYHFLLSPIFFVTVFIAMTFFHSFTVLGWKKFLVGHFAHRGDLYIPRAPQPVSAAILNNESVAYILFYHPGHCMKTIEDCLLVTTLQLQNVECKTLRFNSVRCIWRNEGWIRISAIRASYSIWSLPTPLSTWFHS